MKIKSQTYAGHFYPENKDTLKEMFFKFDDGRESDYASKMIIVPHAGYNYSGHIAYNAYKFLDKSAKNIFILAPAHYEKIYGCITTDYDAFQTPFGNIEVNHQLADNFADICGGKISNFPFDKEHSIEVQLPFIKYFFPHAKIIPILYGCEDFTNLFKGIEKFYYNKENGFVISSDLSHFYPEKDSVKIDNYSAKMIESNNIKNFEIEQACGAVGICAAVSFSKSKNYTFIRLALTNSASFTGDSSGVVGYGSWFLFEGDKNDYIAQKHSDILLKTARESIQSGFQLGSYTPENYPCVLEENGTSFVTLELDGELRGCIGSVLSTQSLIKSVYKNAHAAAFSDSRFPPLTVNEFSRLKINISILSPLKHLKFNNKEDLFKQIMPYKDGVLIRDGLYSAVFLPEVWEFLPDKEVFWNELIKKAEMPQNYQFKNLEVFTFQTTHIMDS